MCQNYDSLKASKAVIGLVSGDLDPLRFPQLTYIQSVDKAVQDRQTHGRTDSTDENTPIAVGPRGKKKHYIPVVHLYGTFSTLSISTCISPVLLFKYYSLFINLYVMCINNPALFGK